MFILVINCGSSSARYQLFDITRWSLLARGLLERIGARAESTLTHQLTGSEPQTVEFACRDHYFAIQKIIGVLCDPGHGCIKDPVREISGIGHRVVHGQEKFKRSTLITRSVIRSLEKFSELAPLHNPPSLFGIKACQDLLKGVPQVAVLDTSFHQTMPAHAYMYGLPYEYYSKYAVRKYGFHGTSHRYVSHEASRLLGRPLKTLRLITCHLGNGCSMAAVDRGESIDTTMGFTPLEGLLMGTRSGDIDAACALFVMDKENRTSHEMIDLLNKKSGLLGISGISNDMRDVREAASKGNERAALAVDMFVYRIKKYIGAFYAAMGSLDAVIFTAGIGEHNPWLTKRIERETRGILPKKVRFMVIPTNEELLIAQDTYGVISKASR